MNEITTKALLWMAQDMGLDHVIESEDGNVRYGRLNKIIDLSGDTIESKALLWDVFEFLERQHGIIILPDCQIRGWLVTEQVSINGHRQVNDIAYGKKHEAIRAAVMYLYEISGE